MDIFIGLFIFVFGAIVGSFLNVVILRKNTGESIVWDGSHCFSCGHKLGVLDLVPIFSFLLSKGRCRYCGSKISWQYPVVEAITGAIALLTFLKIAGFQPYAISFTPDGLGLTAYGLWLFYFSAFSALLLIAIYDFKQKIIDTHFLVVFSVFVPALWFVWRAPNLADFVSSFFIALFFYLMWRLSDGRWMGRGDANLALPLSLFLGWPANLTALVVSFWLGGLTGIFLLIFQNKKYGLKSEIPFGPFLALACFIVWYASSFFESFWIW